MAVRAPAALLLALALAFQQPGLTAALRPNFSWDTLGNVTSQATQPVACGLHIIA
jgi:hypothetical protein